MCAQQPYSTYEIVKRLQTMCHYNIMWQKSTTNILFTIFNGAFAQPTTEIRNAVIPIDHNLGLRLFIHWAQTKKS